MISKNAFIFCEDDISLIENYEQAINDTTQTWDCHHRLETDFGLSQKELIDSNRYFNVSAKDLIFITHAEHTILHRTGKKQSEETKRKRSKSMKGKNKGKPSPMKSKHHTEESKYLIGEASKQWHKNNPGAMKGENNPMYGKSPSEETRRKTSESMKGKNKGKRRVYTPDGKYHYEKSANYNK